MHTIQPSPAAPPAPSPEPEESAPCASLAVAAPPGRLARARQASRALASDIGQGTVEYVGLLLLMATLLAAIVGAASQLGGKDQIGKKVVNQIGTSIDKAGSGER